MSTFIQVLTLGLLIPLTIGTPNQLPRFVPPGERRQPAPDGKGTMGGQSAIPSGPLDNPFLHSGKPLVFPAPDGRRFFAAAFNTARELQSFQQKAGIATERIDGILVQLQPAAMKAFLAARMDAKRSGLDLSPFGSRASRQGFDEMVEIWQPNLDRGFNHWIAQRRLTAQQAKVIRSLPFSKQMTAVAALEKKGLYFGNRFQESILDWAQGKKEHQLMLALDVAQYNHPRIRRILARYGWVQTIRGDKSHFVYLGAGRFTAESKPRRIDGQQNSTRPTRISDKTGMSGSKAKQTAPSRSSKTEAPVALTSSGKAVSRTYAPEAFRNHAAELSRRLSEVYFARAGRALYITSGYRSPRSQARAMYHNLRAYGVTYVLRTYKQRAAAREVVAAYSHNRRYPARALATMVATIERQVQRGVYVSRHMLGRAFDVRKRSTELPALRQTVASLRGHVGVEANHFHCQF